MKIGGLQQIFEDARNIILGGLVTYVKSHNNKVMLDHTERARVSASDRYYTSRYKYVSLEYMPENGVILTYLFNPAQEDTDEPNGGWEECKDEIGYFSCDELFNMIEDIIEE